MDRKEAIAALIAAGLNARARDRHMDKNIQIFGGTHSRGPIEAWSRMVELYTAADGSWRTLDASSGELDNQSFESLEAAVSSMIVQIRSLPAWSEGDE